MSSATFAYSVILYSVTLPPLIATRGLLTQTGPSQGFLTQGLELSQSLSGGRSFKRQSLELLTEWSCPSGTSAVREGRIKQVCRGGKMDTKKEAWQCSTAWLHVVLPLCISVLCCHNQVPQTGWLKTTEIDSLKVLEASSPRLRHYQDRVLLRALREGICSALLS